MDEIFKKIPVWVITISILVFLAVFLERVYIAGKPMVFFGQKFGPAETPSGSKGSEGKKTNISKVYMPSTYRDTNLALVPCLEKAKEVLKSVGVTDIESSKYVVWGYIGQYTVRIACFTNKDLIDILVAGPSSNAAVDLRDEIAAKF